MTNFKSFHQIYNSLLLKSLLLVSILLSFTACKDGLDGLYKNPCRMTEDDKLAQKAIDIEVIKKHFEDNNLDLSEYKTTASGLYYKNLVEGTGEQIKSGDKIEVHYVGKLLNGAPFDSSYDRAQAFKMTVGAKDVIEGWDEVLQLMRVGDDTRVYIPSYLAYGRCGSGTNIGPNTVLMFDIKVLRKL
jgi:FKBP-type peptidyl-prolyl cis-trans isomerase